MATPNLDPLISQLASKALVVLGVAGVLGKFRLAPLLDFGTLALVLPR